MAMLVSMMVFLSGCGGDDKTFVGEWTAEVDATDYINAQFAEDPEMAEYVEASDFVIVLDFEFKADGTYEIKADKDGCTEAFENLKKDLEKGMTKALEAQIEELGLDVTVEEALEASGTSMEALLNEAFGEDQLNEMLEEFEAEGKYLVKDGKFFTTDDVDAEISEDEYEKYEIVSKDEIKLLEGVYEEEDENLELLYPMVLKRK